MNAQLTEWLQVIWEALAEEDESKRTDLLKRANSLLIETKMQGSGQSCCHA
jgi:hypothetical protein